MDENFFAENLRYLRLLRGYTLIECGEFFDLGKSQISLYENAKSYPPIPIARKICHHFGIGLTEMFEADLRPSPNGKRISHYEGEPPNGSAAQAHKTTKVVELSMDAAGVSTIGESPPEPQEEEEELTKEDLKKMKRLLQLIS